MANKETQEFLTATNEFAQEFAEAASDGKMAITEILGLGDNVFKVYVEGKDFDLIKEELKNYKNWTPGQLVECLQSAIGTIENLTTGIKDLIAK